MRAAPAPRRLVLVVAIGLALAGCGSQASPGPGSPAPSASGIVVTLPTAAPGAVCSLVPDMDDLVGRPALAPPSDFSVGPITRCTWVYGADPTRNVGVSLGPLSAHLDTIGAFGDGEAVDGLGDEARWWSGNRTLSVSVGDQSIQVDLQLDEADASRDLAVSIARSALANLD